MEALYYIKVSLVLLPTLAEETQASHKINQVLLLTRQIADTSSFGAKPGGTIAAKAIAQIPGIKSGAECIPQLTVNKTTSTPGPIIKPGKAIYTIRVSNTADRATATNITISDPLPSGFTFDGSTAPTINLTGRSNPKH